MTDMPSVPAAVPPKKPLALIIAGYICAALCLVIAPLIFGIAAIVIGIITIRKGAKGHGIAHIVLAVLFTALSILVIADRLANN